MTKERAAKIILDMINGAESTFGHSLSTTEIIALKKAYCALNPEPTTNADRIRAMTDEELANWLGVYCNGKTAQEVGKPCVSDMGSCEECWIDWLKQESEDEW